jgi:hypothetical protein
MKANATREQPPNAGATRRPRQMRFSDDGTLHYISSAEVGPRGSCASAAHIMGVVTAILRDRLV